jgi:hypothetical protein
MFHPEQFEILMLDNPPVPSAPPFRSACLVPGCPCKDARIVSHRRAAFFAALARGAGETADRVVPLDPAWAFTWVVPASPDVDFDDEDEEMAA